MNNIDKTNSDTKTMSLDCSLKLNKFFFNDVKNEVVKSNSKYFLKPKEVETLLSDCPNVKPSCSSFIVYDLETSGLSLTEAEILQVSAVCGDQQFDAYISPTKGISRSASAVNQLTQKNDILHYKGLPVKTSSLDEVLMKFISWMKELPRPRIMLGHNIKKFDCPRIYASLVKCNLISEFCEVVDGFIDTLPLFKEIKPGMSDYKQTTLVSAVVKKSYDAHNAIEDVKSLQELLQNFDISDETFNGHSFSSKSTLEWFCYDMKVKECVKSFDNMINKKIITKTLAYSLAKTGINYYMLLTSFKLGGETLVEEIFNQTGRENLSGLISPSILKKIAKHLSQKL